MSLGPFIFQIQTMEFLVALVGEVVKFTVKPVGRQFGYVLFYRSNIRRLQESVESLRNTRKDVDVWVLSARSNNEEITYRMKEWMDKVDEITKQVERFCEEGSQANTGRSHSSCLNLWLRHQIGRKAKKMWARVDELLRFPPNWRGVSYRPLPL